MQHTSCCRVSSLRDQQTDRGQVPGGDCRLQLLIQDECEIDASFLFFSLFFSLYPAGSPSFLKPAQAQIRRLPCGSSARTFPDSPNAAQCRPSARKLNCTACSVGADGPAAIGEGHRWAPTAEKLRSQSQIIHEREHYFSFGCSLSGRRNRRNFRDASFDATPRPTFVDEGTTQRAWTEPGHSCRRHLGERSERFSVATVTQLCCHPRQ